GVFDSTLVVGAGDSAGSSEPQALSRLAITAALRPITFKRRCASPAREVPDLTVESDLFGEVLLVLVHAANLNRSLAASKAKRPEHQREQAGSTAAFRS